MILRVDKFVVILSAFFFDFFLLIIWYIDKVVCLKVGCLLIILKIDINYWYNRGMILNMGNVESLRVDVVAEF